MKEQIIEIIDNYYDDACIFNYESAAEEITALFEAEIEKRMPTDEEMNEEANKYGKLAAEGKNKGYEIEEFASLDFLRGASWFRNRMKGGK